MRNGKCTKPKRLLSIFLAVLVAVSILPMSWLQASAATEKHPDAVTITVTDGKGKALADAVVNYTIVSQTDVENLISGTVMTDEDGCAEVLSVDGYKENDLELTAQVSKEHYESNDTTIVSLPITSADQNFAVSLRCMLIENVTVTGVAEAYADGKKFPAATVEGIVTDGEHPDKVTYQLGNGEKTKAIPQIQYAGTYSVTVRVERENYEPFK